MPLGPILQGAECLSPRRLEGAVRHAAPNRIELFAPAVRLTQEGACFPRGAWDEKLRGEHGTAAPNFPFSLRTVASLPWK